MSEKFYAFIKNNRVMNIAVFASKDDELATRIAQEQNCDNAIWVESDKPHLHSLYDGKAFTPPTPEYLYEIGVLEALPVADNTDIQV